MSSFAKEFDSLDRRITQWLALHSITVLRVAIGIIFLWFGALKLFPGISPAEDLATRTIAALSFGVVNPEVSRPVLAIWECLIGVGLLSGIWLRVTLALLAFQMAGTVTPLFLFPLETFIQPPLVPTMEGQYIIKNLALVAGAMVVGSTVRGGQLKTD